MERNWLRPWAPQTQLRPVLLASPHPPGECARRLAAVTTSRGLAGWHLNPRNAGRPEPRLRGEVGQDRILVAGFADASGRNSFAAWLDASLESSAGGGTRLTGTAGLHPSARTAFRLVSVLWAAITLIVLAAGIALLATGQLTGLAAAATGVFAAAIFAGVSAAGLRSLERAIPRLITEISGILDAISAG